MTARRKFKLIEPMVGKEELEAIKKVLDSGWLTEGPRTKKFENKVAEYVGAKYAIATCNCTVAIELCLKALNVKGEVIIPDFTHPATANAVYNAGATPVLADVDINTYNIDLNEIEQAITAKTEAIVPVSWAGNPLNNEIYKEFEGKFSIIEDAACSLGSQLDGKKTGTLTDATCFSFHPRKTVTTGEGGMITTNSEDFMKISRSLKIFGESSDVILTQDWKGSYDYLKWCKGKVKFFLRKGTNYKMSDILSAIGLVQMEKVDTIINRRIEMAENYNELLENIPGVRTPHKDERAKHTYQTYAIYLKRGNRDKIITKLAEKGIETQIGTYALHMQPAFEHTPKSGKLANSYLLHKNLLALPMCHSMSFPDQEYIVEQIKKTLNL